MNDSAELTRGAPLVNRLFRDLAGRTDNPIPTRFPPQDSLKISTPSTYPADFAELVLGLLGRDAVHDEAALHVVDDAEVLAGLLNLDNVHEAGGEAGIRPHVAVNLDQALLHNRLHLLHGQGVLQPIPEEKTSMLEPEDSVADPWHFGVDPVPRIYASDKCICILLFTPLTLEMPTKN
jgi:hypothetical protein